MADAVRLAQLIVNRIKGTITPWEEAELDAWINASPENKAFMENEIRYEELAEDMLILAEMDEVGLDETAWRTIEEALARENIKPVPQNTAPVNATIHHSSRRRGKGLLISGLTIAAILLFLFLNNALSPAQKHYSPSRTAIWNSLSLAITKPVLTPILTISKDLVLGLDTAQEGRMAWLGNWIILKTSRQHIAYVRTNNSRKAAPADDSLYNVISLPPGGTETLQITLPDGSSVTLDPGSSLSFSVHPTGKKTPQRMVALNGSAFFQVSHDPESPFVLETNKNEIKVYGTSFSIKDHQEDATSTVLQYSGRLEVTNGNASAILDSAQQATIDPAAARIPVEKNVTLPLRPIAPLEAFDFSRQDLTTAMQEIKQYYRMASVHIDPDLDTRTPGKLRMGKIPKDLPLDKLLHALEQDSMHFSATEEAITVTK